jgi:hypothetical protein
MTTPLIVLDRGNTIIAITIFSGVKFLMLGIISE